MAKKSNLLISIVLICAAMSCSSRYGRDFSEFVAVDADGWVYGDTLRYVARSVDSVICGSLVVNVCHDDDYVYSNLWVEVTYPSVDSAVTRRDTVNIPLANRYGQWYGRGFGTTFQASDTVNTCFRLRRGDTLSVRHIMRVDTLRHISQIGLSLNSVSQ